MFRWFVILLTVPTLVCAEVDTPASPPAVQTDSEKAIPSEETPIPE